MQLSIDGYKKITYSQLIQKMKKSYNESGKDIIKLMTSTGRKVNTIRNVFNKQKQIVPDLVFQKSATALNIDCVIVIHNGNRYYFISESPESVSSY